ncbi:MAG TPA: universal stress protein [Nocardioidaceae bacterium]|nr:universal stress protein [Nocardioidaceae bacterium]
MTAQPATTVVVGVDGTRDGERAIEYASALAAREHLDLRLVHVPHEYAMYAPMAPYLPQVTMREIGDIGESVLQEAAKHAEENGVPGERTSTVLAWGPRTEALLQQVGDAKCIVLGSRTSTVQHLLTGATSLSVVAHSVVPVRCIPPAWSGPRSAAGRIVVGVDGSKADALVLQEAFAEADAAGARIEIVHAWRPVSPYDAAITGRVLRDDWDKTTREQLTRSIELVAAAHQRVVWELRLDYERVTVALHEAAAQADLLVLGRHGHRGPLGLLVGSTTRTLLHHAPCPIEVVPLREDDR